MEINGLHQTCDTCPSRWEFVTGDSRPVRVDYRYGFLSVAVGKSHAGRMSAALITPLFGRRIGEPSDSTIGWQDVVGIVKAIPVPAAEVGQLAAVGS